MVEFFNFNSARFVSSLEIITKLRARIVLFEVAGGGDVLMTSLFGSFELVCWVSDTRGSAKIIVFKSTGLGSEASGVSVLAGGDLGSGDLGFDDLDSEMTLESTDLCSADSDMTSE